MILLEKSHKSLVYSLCLRLDEVSLMGLSTIGCFIISHFLTGLGIATLQPESSTEQFKEHPFPAYKPMYLTYIFQLCLQTSFAYLNNHSHPFPLLFATPNYLSVTQTCPSFWSLYKVGFFFLLFPS